MSRQPDAQRARWKRDAIVALLAAVLTAIVTASLTYWFAVKLERQRQLTVGRQAEQLRDATVAVVNIANQVSASLGAADRIISTLAINGSADDLEEGRRRWNAADSTWMTNKIGLAHQLDRAIPSDTIDAAWSHMDSTVFQLGEALRVAYARRHGMSPTTMRGLTDGLTARRDTAQAALERFLQVVRPVLAIR